MISKWDERFFELALMVAGWSKDTSTKTGAVIVRDRQILSVGYNGFPRGVDDSVSERYERPQKYEFTEHAERNSVYNAVYNGVSLKGATIYSTLCPCTDCCRAIIQTGIIEVITPTPDNASEKWKESFKVSKEMFDEAGITVKFI